MPSFLLPAALTGKLRRLYRKRPGRNADMGSLPLYLPAPQLPNRTKQNPKAEKPTEKLGGIIKSITFTITKTPLINI